MNPVFSRCRRDKGGPLMDRSMTRRRLCGTGFVGAVALLLSGCEMPTFDPETTTFTFKRRSYGPERN
jgi:hypothetical protein